MKSFSKLILLILFVSQTSLLAQTGKLTGTIYNGSADSAAVKNTDVEILIYRGHNLLDDSSFVDKTNSRGQFQISGLPLDSTLMIYPRTTFSSIVYYGDGVQLTEAQKQAQSNVVVFDSTRSKRHIATQMAHLFLEVENEKIKLRDILMIANTGNKTYMGGKTLISSRSYVLEFPLPQNYENLEILTPGAQNSVFLEHNTLYHTDLMSPGTRQFSYQLDLPFSGKEWNFTRPVIYPTGGLNIFLSQPELTIEGPGIMPMGDFHIKGMKYQHYSVRNLMPGMSLELTLKNLPGKTFPVQWIVLILVGIFVIVGFGYTFLKKQK